MMERLEVSAVLSRRDLIAATSAACGIVVALVATGVLIGWGICG